MSNISGRIGGKIKNFRRTIKFAPCGAVDEEIIFKIDKNNSIYDISPRTVQFSSTNTGISHDCLSVVRGRTPDEGYTAIAIESQRWLDEESRYNTM